MRLDTAQEAARGRLLALMRTWKHINVAIQPGIDHICAAGSCAAVVWVVLTRNIGRIELGE